MQSQCEPFQRWHAAGVQAGLTGIDGKNCTQIINMGHPHVTKRVMHIKMTHLFELNISALAVNRLPLYILRFSMHFHLFSDGYIHHTYHQGFVVQVVFCSTYVDISNLESKYNLA